MAVTAPPATGKEDLRQRLMDGDHEGFAQPYRHYAHSVLVGAQSRLRLARGHLARLMTT